MLVAWNWPWWSIYTIKLANITNWGFSSHPKSQLLNIYQYTYSYYYYFNVGEKAFEQGSLPTY